MNRIKIFFIIILNLILQATVISRLTILGTNANLSIPLFVSLAIGFGPYVGGFSALLIGLVEDLFFSPILGVRSLIYFVFGFLIGDSDVGINKEDIRSGIFLTACITFIYLLYQAVLFGIIGNDFNFFYYLKGPIFVEMILNSFLYVIIHFTFKKIFKFPRFRM